ncbi:hypothetical protein [Bacillus changyiensis]|uniref:hypothetical protein n=1 Tax=Bacillus changyiensis TaxID=3004103 RepID=UPI0022E18C78|nr:hypothetical protein [Bacillus changyiensis]MDA1476324.1 hypothetical protein [Bacillus changyiensis]
MKEDFLAAFLKKSSLFKTNGKLVQPAVKVRSRKLLATRKLEEIKEKKYRKEENLL